MTEREDPLKGPDSSPGLYLQIYDWTQGEGPMPPVGQYLGFDGFLVDSIDDAINVHPNCVHLVGRQGPPGLPGKERDDGP